MLPNGVYFEGSFENNKPKGVGKWRFPDGNVCEGYYEQKEKEEGDEEEENEDKKEEEKIEDDDEDEKEPEPEDEEPADENQDEEKKKFKLIWRSSANLLGSASQIKEIQALE